MALAGGALAWSPVLRLQGYAQDRLPAHPGEAATPELAPAAKKALPEQGGEEVALMVPGEEGFDGLVRRVERIRARAAMASALAPLGGMFLFVPELGSAVGLGATLGGLAGAMVGAAGGLAFLLALHAGWVLDRAQQSLPEDAPGTVGPCDDSPSP